MQLAQSIKSCPLVLGDLVVVPHLAFNLGMTPDHTLLLRIDGPHPLISFKLSRQRWPYGDVGDLQRIELERRVGQVLSCSRVVCAPYRARPRNSSFFLPTSWLY